MGCNDFNNVGKKTESFSKDEYAAASGSSLRTVCGAAPETFISCFDAKVTGPAQPCCKWGSSCGGSCASGWCSSSQANCGGCGGTWCAPSSLMTVTKHE